MRAKNSFYPTLDKKRREFFDEKYKSTAELIKSASAEHKLAIEFKNNLINSKIEEIRKFIGERNKGAAEKIESKTIVLMDATGSMSSLL